MSNIQVPYSIVIWGDSISELGELRNGWVNFLRAEYHGRAFFQNFGIIGLNSTQYLNLVQ